MTSHAHTSAPARTAPLEGLALVAIWAICTIVNLGKAAHIDDTAHLEIARWIQHAPLHPMQGLVDWEGRSAPIAELNQPHLFFYLIAGLGLLTGDLLLAGQIWVAVFLAVGLVSFHALWRRVVGPRGAVLGATVLFVGPAFLPGQNAMTDAPLVCLWILFLYLLVRGDGRGRWWIAAALVVAIATLVKYTSLALIPVLAIDVLSRGREHRRHLAVLAVPVGALTLWSIFNVLDYGGVHLLERPVGASSLLASLGGSIGRALLFVIALGGVVPFAIAALPLVPRRALAIAVAVIIVGAIGTQVAALFVPDIAGESVVTSAARVVFLVVGVVLVGRLAIEARPAVHDALRGRPLDEGGRHTLILASCALAGTAFVIVLAPFMAVRHVLLVLPAILLLLARAYASRLEAHRAWIAASVVTTVLLGLALGISDRRWAQTYRAIAEAHAHDAPRVIFVGHWGWQWHAAEAGMIRYEAGVTELASGDVVIRPHLISQPQLSPEDAARLVAGEPIVIAPGVLDRLRTMTPRYGYYLVGAELPWSVSDAPVEVFDVSTVR
ncbi:MAG: glycosyltransferase family 39 protein [Deltaproteobacteria bacterium]|nr:glycosyltransferase family 39 protein [Deltaproteobacteria bacterium]